MEFQMAVVRTQYGVISASTTIGNASSGTIDLPRPQSAPENDTIDWVTRPAFRKEFESGRAVITPDATLGVANTKLVAIYIMALQPFTSLAPIDLSFSQFPNPPVAGMSPTLRTILDLTASPSTSPYNLDLTATTSPGLDLLKNILLRADEFVRVVLYNAAGGPVTGVLEARYDFGLNAGNYGSLPLLI